MTPMTNWTRASTTLKEHTVSKTYRESAKNAAQLQKEDKTPALQELHDVKEMIGHA